MTETFWWGRRVFVTGCTGLLGSWLTEELVRRGAWVVGLVRDSVPRSRLIQERVIERIDVVRGAVEDLPTIERALTEYEVETVFHLAAQTIVGTANRAPLATFEANVRGTWNILEASRRAATVREVVVASSDKAYGNHEDLPYDERHALQGRHPYDVSKSAADLITQAYWHTFKLPVAVTRCANLFGGGDLNFNRLVPATVRSGLRGEAPIIRSDGQRLRDYLYVEDAVLAYLMLAETLAADDEVHGQAFNVSYEAPLTVNALVDKILLLVGNQGLTPIILNESTNEIPDQYLSSSKARIRLSWKPAYSLEEGLRRTIEWYRTFLRP